MVVPELGEQIEKEADPYQYALNVNVTPDMKSILVNKMEKAIDGINSTKKAEMYAAVRGVEWLRQFVKLPFGRITSKFEIVAEGSRGCNFAQVKADFGEFVKILSSYVPLTDDSVQALYMITKKKTETTVDYEDGSVVEEDEDNSNPFIVNKSKVQELEQKDSEKLKTDDRFTISTLEIIEEE